MIKLDKATLDYVIDFIDKQEFSCAPYHNCIAVFYEDQTNAMKRDGATMKNVTDALCLDIIAKLEGLKDAT